MSFRGGPVGGHRRLINIVLATIRAASRSASLLLPVSKLWDLRSAYQGFPGGLKRCLLSMLVELFYQLLSEDLRLKQQRTEEMRMENEQNLYMPYEFDWEFGKEWR